MASLGSPSGVLASRAGQEAGLSFVHMMLRAGQGRPVSIGVQRRLVSITAAGLLLAVAAALPAVAGGSPAEQSGRPGYAGTVTELRADEQPASSPFPFDDADCGPPSEAIPGPPPWLIVVGRPMSDSWLMCYVKQDLEGQTYFFDGWGEIRRASFRGYPDECWTPEADAGWSGRRTDGTIAQVYGWNLDRTQYVRFTYRIQLDGDYINNCHQEILPTPS